MRVALAILSTFLCLVLATALAADTPSAPARYRTLKDLVAASPGKPLHIVYIHGIRASASGFSGAFRASLCQRLGGCDAGPVETSRALDLGPAPPAEFLGRRIWNDVDWTLSQPFVEHFTYRRAGRPVAIVDEINYWPLLLALKCQFLVPSDAPLSGADGADLKTCSTNDPAHHLHAWIRPDVAQALIDGPAASGGAARVNKALKIEIMNWGLSDAVIALGPMKQYTRLAVWCALEEIAAFNPDAPSPQTPRSCGAENNAGEPGDDQQFVIISESLGSFVLMDSFAAAVDSINGTAEPQDASVDAAPPPPASACLSKDKSGSALCYIVKRSDNIYFFANQVSLLELGRLQGIGDLANATPPAQAQARIANALQQWARLGASSKVFGPKQLIAFNDPSDILTDNIPDFCGMARQNHRCTGVFDNLYVHNRFDWFGLFEDPVAAHTTYSQNPKVLDTIYGP